MFENPYLGKVLFALFVIGCVVAVLEVFFGVQV